MLCDWVRILTFQLELGQWVSGSVGLWICGCVGDSSRLASRLVFWLRTPQLVKALQCPC